MSDHSVQDASAIRGGYYVCQRCTACCRWPGQVRISNGEIQEMATCLGVSELDFIQRYTRLRHDRRGLVLEEQAGGACVFLDGHDCRVQGAKPRQCCEFPNSWNFPGWEKTCQAVFRVGQGRVGRLASRPGNRRLAVMRRLL